MTIPDFQTLMRPVLEHASLGVTTPKETVEVLAKKFNLSEEDLKVMLPSKRAPMFYNRVAWAKFYLQQAGLIQSPRRGFFEISAEGKEALKKTDKIDINFLKSYKVFSASKAKGKDSNYPDTEAQLSLDSEIPETPDEIIRNAHESINNALALELLSSIRDCSPRFFEQLIVDLLLAMGYGGSSEEAGRALGQSGDNGVDGVIDQDPLGVDQIYIQAKRYKEGNNIGAGDIRDFYGSLSLKKANKGMFVTTSDFSPSAIQTSKDLGHRIVLINGKQLAKLMIRYNVGCRDERVLHIKKIDEEYFDLNY